MVTGVTSPSGGDLKQLRQQYDRLCDLMTRTAESNPEAAERVLGELEVLSERILALESADGAAAPEPSEPVASAGAPVTPSASAGIAVSPSDEPEPSRPAPPASRIVSFRVTPVVGARDSAPPAAVPGAPPAQPASWRIDPAARPAEPPAAPPPAQPQPSTAVQPQPPSPAEAAPPAAAVAPRGNATMFSAAIRQWLERHRGAAAEDEAGVAAPAPAAEPSPTEPAADTPGVAAPEFARIAAAIEQQATQIERIMGLCEEHQAALERLEAQIETALQAPRQPADREAEPRITELRSAVEEQRLRITALAKTIHNLAQWLAAQHAAPDR